MALETALARASMNRVARRDPEAVYHLTSTDALQRGVPSIGWNAYFRHIGVARPAEVNLAQPDYLKAFYSLLTRTPPSDWQAYLRWQLLAAAARSSARRLSTRVFTSTRPCCRA